MKLPKYNMSYNKQDLVNAWGRSASDRKQNLLGPFYTSTDDLYQ